MESNEPSLFRLCGKKGGRVVGVIASVSLSGENLQLTEAVFRKMFNLAHVNFVFSGKLAPRPFRPRRSFDGSYVGAFGGGVCYPTAENRLEDPFPKTIVIYRLRRFRHITSELPSNESATDCPLEAHKDNHYANFPSVQF
jgi:hypothetical protein